jgi:hypothetical protein
MLCVVLNPQNQQPTIKRAILVFFEKNKTLVELVARFF